MLIMDYSLDNIFSLQSRKQYMGLAILWIIGYHFYIVQQSFFDNNFPIYRFLFRNGFVGVDIFFILSAYGLCHSWEKSTIKNYAKKRFIKIMPIYILFLFICKFILKIEDNFWSDSLLQISSLSIFNTKYTNPVNMNGEWFVPAIINLYIIFPFLFLFIKKVLIRYPKKGGYIVVFISILIAEFLKNLISLNYITRFPIIISGILTYLYLKNKDYRNLFGTYIFFAILSFLFIRVNLIFSLIIPLILKCINDLNIKLNNKFLNFCGTISFELYLSHIIPMNFCADKNIIVALMIMIFGTLLLTFVFMKISSYIRNFV